MKRMAIVSLLAFTFSAVPSLASAQLSLGARSGYSLAAGDMVSGLPYSQAADGFVPLQLEAAYHVGAGISVGAYASYGIGIQNATMWSTCGSSGVHCSARQLRAGVQATWTLRSVSSDFTPWFGAGAGWEWLTLDLSTSDAFTRDRWSGPELANLQFGVDIKHRNPTFGPYLMLSFSRFDDRRIEVDAGVTSGAVADRTIHRNVSFGLRGAFEL